jgi:murein DD-endopeptidase MepM/ murein hydrolase activator NlpD
MSEADRNPSSPFARRKPPHQIIIARGTNVRTIVLRPWLMGTMVAVGAIFGMLYLAATFYLVFRDDLLAASIARQARIQHAYEDRIASLRADIDRLTSRQLINQQAFDTKMSELIDRQAALDARQDIIAGISQSARRAGLFLAPGHAPAAHEARTAPEVPAVTGSIKAGGDPVVASFLRPSRPDAPVAMAEPPAARIGAVENSLDNLAAQQVAYVEAVGRKARQKTEKIETVLAKLGHMTAARKSGQAGNVGGPFVPLAVNSDLDTFRSGADVVAAEIAGLDAAKRAASRLPLTRPVANAAITSRFGARLDPLLGRPALHTGVDFRAASGYPVRATAAGTVIAAEYSGGYGNMVEIDHGNGLTTRYAHMSRISVKAGDILAKGAIVGRAGSTGRSTGPHVHYEVRADGKALDPMRYIRAGGEIAPLL